MKAFLILALLTAQGINYEKIYIKNITLLDTLLHEIAHMIAHKSEIRLKNLGEEGVASFIGSEFSKVFLQNPKLVNLIKKCVAK